MRILFRCILVLIMLVFLSGCLANKDPNAVTLLNVSYDPTREFYQDFNKSFASFWEKQSDQDVRVLQSHGGSGKQARSVIDGLEADVVTLALAYDIDAIADKGLIPKNWQQRLPHNSSPYYSTVVFLVRKGNPKKIRDWDDLSRDEIQVITPNPKTSGGARWNYLAAWGSVLQTRDKSSEAANRFVEKLYRNVPVLDTGARGSTTTFIERGIGDVLIAWENEALLVIHKLAPDQFDLVVPTMSILAEPPVTVVDKIVKKHGTSNIAHSYLEYLYSEEGQELAAKHFYRPRLEKIAEKYKDQFPETELFTVDELFGGWENAQQLHFSDNGIFDQIYNSTQ